MSVSTARSTTVFTTTTTTTTTSASASASASAINFKEGLDLVPNIFTQQGDSEIEGNLATNDEPSRQCCGYSN